MNRSSAVPGAQISTPPAFNSYRATTSFFSKSCANASLLPTNVPSQKQPNLPDAMTPNPTTKPNPPKEPARDAPCPALTTKAVKKTILVVDDDEQIRESLHKVLCAEGYKVVLAAAGWEGIVKFNAERIDCLLLDVNLPDMSGWEVFGTITSINPFLPIIIITGKDEQHDLAVLGGVGALIEKPLNVSNAVPLKSPVNIDDFLGRVMWGW